MVPLTGSRRSRAHIAVPDWKQAFTGWGLSWDGWLHNRRGEWWLLAQLILIAAHLAPTWPAPDGFGVQWPSPLRLIGLMVLMLGLALALQGFLALGANFSPLPDPKPGAALITEGVYRQCRHPLYRAVLVCSLGVVIALGSGLHLLLLTMLCVLLMGKARREEKALLGILPSYATYRTETPAIVAHCPGLDWRN